MARPGGAPENLIPSKPGERRGGRKKGSKNKLTREMVENELRRLAFSDPKLLFTTTYGKRRVFTLREIDEMPEDIRRCIASVKVRTENLTAGDNNQDQTVEVKLWDKVKALELCGRALGMFKDKIELSGEGIDQILAAGRARAAARNGKVDSGT